jgi:putative endonuclease
VYSVYIIQSSKDKSYYTGVTTNPDRRLKEHNSGFSKYSSFKGPFVMVWNCDFINKQKAYKFEKYLKTGSGIAFRNKHLT